MNKILLIGNSGLEKHGDDGQTVKVRLYLKKIKDEGYTVNFVDLENISKHPFSTLRTIKKGIKNCDRIVLLTANRGCKYLIPFINRNNKKFKKPFILPLIGISVLHNSLDRLNDQEKNDFLVKKAFSLAKKDYKTSKMLSTLTYVLPETELLTDVFTDFYELNNVVQLNNFRDIISLDNERIASDELKLVFLSRVMTIKGIFDLLDVVKQLVDSGHKITLDIFGKTTMSVDEESFFEKYIDCQFINYHGAINNDEVSNILSKFDLFVFPTRYLGEGTPGVVSESLIVGTPILTAGFPQAPYLLKNGVDSIFYEMFNKEDLKNKLLYIINNKSIIHVLREGALKSGQKYTYKHERDKFLKYVCGAEEK